MKYCFGLCLLVSVNVFCQVIPVENREVSNYLAIDNSSEKIQKVVGNILSLHYYDHLGTTESIPLKIFNYKKELVSDFLLQKQPGQNYYDIHLPESFLNIPGHFIALIEDEKGGAHRLSFKMVSPSRELLSTSIIANVIDGECSDLTILELQFTGQIDGIGPFDVEWQFLSTDKTTLIHEEIKEKIQASGKTKAIHIYGRSDFVLMMHTRDACGNEDTKVLQILCAEEHLKSHTIQFESIKIPNIEL